MSNPARGSFQELEIWERAITIAVSIYELAATLPADERFGIKSQLCRAAISISSNIAEGHGRNSKGDFARFCRIAMGSLRECQSLLAISHRLGLVVESKQADQDLEILAKKLFRFIQSLEKTG